MRTFRVFLILGVIALLLIPTMVSGQEQGKVKLTPYEGNPILTLDKTLAWEAGGVGRQRVISYKGLVYMFYQGYTVGQTAGSVGYATSQDGLHWTKYKDNPVFVPDKKLAPNGVMQFAVVLNGETWTIYFTAWPSGKTWYGFTGDILVATAPSPSGPWTVAAEPVLTESNDPAWDSGGRYFFTVTRSKDGYSMFYGAGVKAGMATSSDGMKWVKYNDPATTSDRYAASDPVFEPSQNPEAWDRGTITQTVVRLTDKGWEMFYAGGESATSNIGMSIGYATSPDGIKWTRLGDTKLLTDPYMLLYPEAVVEVNGKHYLYYAVVPPTFDRATIVNAVATITYQ